jgi:hypothetical protein
MWLSRVVVTRELSIAMQTELCDLLDKLTRAIVDIPELEGIREKYTAEQYLADETWGRIMQIFNEH